MAISTIGTKGLDQAADTILCGTSGNVGIGTASPNYKLQTKVTTDKNLGVGSNINLADGITLASVNDANGANKGLEIRGTSTTITAPGASAFINFRTGNTEAEAMRIDSSGNIGIGAAPASARLRVSATWPQNLFDLYVTSGNPSAQVAAFGFNGAAVGTIICTASSTAYNTSSDYRLKENVAPMQNALSVVQQLKPVTYNWKIDGSDGQGFIAHELAEVVPDCVTGEKDAVDEEGNPVYQGIDTSFLVATLTAAIQELKAEFDAYKASHP